MKTVKDAVNDQFGKVAANYRTSRVHATGADLTQIADLVGQFDQAEVLDVGCGGGHATVAAAPAAGKVIALDLSREMLAQVTQLAEERGLNNVETRVGDAESLPFEDERFDVVLTRFSSHHWPNPSAGLQECWRVLKPQGLFINSDLIAPEDLATDTFLQTIELIRDHSHVRDHTVAQWLAMFEQTRFEAKVDSTWTIDINLERWTTRIGTPKAYVPLLEDLFKQAPDPIRDYFNYQDNGDFVLHCALFVAQKPS